MKRYLVFSGWDAYERGGARDFKGDYDTEKQAQAKVAVVLGRDDAWAQIIDTQTAKYWSSGRAIVDGWVALPTEDSSEGRGVTPDAKEFIEEVIAAGRKRGLSLSHEDGHGAFIVEPYDDLNAEWLRNAHQDSGDSK